MLALVLVVENVKVAREMLFVRGTGRKSHIKQYYREATYGEGYI